MKKLLIGETRDHSIDVLRGASILLVVITHGFLNLKWLGWTNFIPKRNFEILRSNGYLGVSIFFVISGFLITRGILSRNHSGDIRTIEVSIPEFYLSRAARIFPPLILLFLITFIISHSGFEFFSEFKGVPAFIFALATVHAFTFTYNNFYLGLGGSTSGIRHLIPLWSLSIEEFFYLAWPIVLRILKRKYLLCLALVLILFLSPAYRIEHGYISEYSVQGCVDMLAFGCLSALISSSLPSMRDSLRRIGTLIIFILQVAVLCIIDIHEHFVIAQTIVGFITFSYILISRRPGDSNHTLSPAAIFTFPLRLLGFLSYEIYLFHLMFMNIFYEIDVKRGTNYLSSLLPLLCLVVFSIGLNLFIFEPLRQKIIQIFR